LSARRSSETSSTTGAGDPRTLRRQTTFDRPVIGANPADRGAESASMITAQHPQSIQAEAYREPRTNVQFIQLIGDMESLVVTSSLIGEEKTSSAINLAHVLAHAGERVLLIDADLRRPSVAEHLDLESTAGLTSVLIETTRLEDVTQPLEKEGLDVLASGPVPLNPSELLGSQRMKQLLDAAGADYEYVVFDSAPPARRHRRRGPLARRGRHGHWSRKAIASSRSSLERPWRRRMPSMPICGDRLCWGSSSTGAQRSSQRLHLRAKTGWLVSAARST